MQSSSNDHIQPFYAFSHWAMRLFMVLLATVSVVTSGNAIWQLAQSGASFTGAIVEVSETTMSRRSAIYELVLRADEGQLRFVRLRNNGRILNHLMERDQSEYVARRVNVDTKQGIASALSFLDGSPAVVRESRIQPAGQLLVGLLSLFILIPLLWPNLAERRSN